MILTGQSHYVTINMENLTANISNADFSPPGRTSRPKRASSSAMASPCGTHWKAAPSPARRTPLSGTWCRTTLHLFWQKRPLRQCSATGPPPTAFIPNICCRCPAFRRSSCPAPAPPTPPAAPKPCARSGARPSKII